VLTFQAFQPTIPSAAINAPVTWVVIYARFGGLGFNFQPELYITGKNLNIEKDGVVNKAKFTSIDVPLLLGTKVGAFGLGGRFYAGPLASFAITKDQSTGEALGNATRLNYKSANIAGVVGAGLDIRDFSVDLRYESRFYQTIIQ
jgi:hypothetical protein